VQAFAQRYPWVERYTVINEPFVTAWLSGYCEIWHPHGKGDGLSCRCW
jgi:dTDP-4-dehydrorhamnose reductase